VWLLGHAKAKLQIRISKSEIRNNFKWRKDTKFQVNERGVSEVHLKTQIPLDPPFSKGETSFPDSNPSLEKRGEGEILGEVRQRTSGLGQ
jgi:hypothetical protein